MSLMPRLLVRPRRDVTESRSNYLLRLAQQNYLSGLPELADMVGLRPSEMVSMTDDALAQFLRGVNLNSVAPPVNRPTDTLELVRRRLWSKCRICPRCLRLGHTTPIYFDYCLSLRCEVHQIYLLDHCASCNQPLSYLRKRSFHCDCGQALANLPSIKVDSAVDLFESLLTPWRDGKTWFLDEEIVLKQEVRIAKALRSIVDFVNQNWDSRTTCQPWLYLEDWPIIKALISPWPTSLAEGVLASDALLDSKRLGQLLTILDSSEHPFLLKLKHKLDAYRKEARQPVSATCAPLVSLRQVRKLAKLDAAATTELFNSSFFSIKEVRNGPRGPTFWVSKVDFEKLTQWLNETVSLERAAEIIGCSSMSIRGLSRLKKLQAVFLPGKSRSPRFFRSNIDTFIKSIESLLADNLCEEHSLVPLAKVAPAKANCKRWCSNWPIFIGGILAGTVPIYRIGGKRGWEGIGVRADDIKKCIYTLD